MNRHKLPFRQIHLDFHTSPLIPDVGSEFDAREFARIMQAAHVNSVTLFAKCHHGHLYYTTKHPARHPALPRGLNLLGRQIEALHRVGIRAPIYLSVQCDEYAANTHPEWIALDPQGKLVAPSPLAAGWQIMDMSSPYQDYLAEQLADVLERFKPVDGIFLDMCWDQPSCSKWALAGMVKDGLDPEKEADRKQYAHTVSLRYMARYKQQIEAAHGGKPTPVSFNSRPLSNMAEEARFLRHIEIEALPTGGWGYLYFPINVRFARNFGRSCLGMTARFHKSWADFGGLKPAAALKYECCQMLAHGARCSIGDQLHPRGRLDSAVYRHIGRVYEHVENCEPWCDGARPLTEIGVILQNGDANQEALYESIKGAVQALQPLAHQFDFIPPDADFGRYRLIVVPESVSMQPQLAARLERYARKGGAVMLVGAAALAANGAPALSGQGVRALGPSPFQTVYLRFDGPFAEGIEATDNVMYERGLRMQPANNGCGFVKVVEPYFDRNWRHFSSHFQTPPARVSKYFAVVQKGRIVTVAFPIFKAVAAHGNVPYRRLIGQCIEQIMPDPLVRWQAPSYAEIALTSQPGRLVVHMLAYSAQRKTATLDLIEDEVPLHDVPVSARVERPVRRVELAPQRVALPFTLRGNRVDFVVPCLRGHQMVALNME